MLQSVEFERSKHIAPCRRTPSNAEFREVPADLDGDYGDDGSQFLDQMLWLWRQP